MRFSRALLFLVSAAAFVNLAFAFARRLVYPYDLEWMEGGMIGHALRLVEGQPIYAEPSARFVSFAYTPLYPIVLRLLAPLTGVGYRPPPPPPPSSGAPAAREPPRSGRRRFRPPPSRPPAPGTIWPAWTRSSSVS